MLFPFFGGLSDIQEKIKSSEVAACCGVFSAFSVFNAFFDGKVYSYAYLGRCKVFSGKIQ